MEPVAAAPLGPHHWPGWPDRVPVPLRVEGELAEGLDAREHGNAEAHLASDDPRMLLTRFRAV